MISCHCASADPYIAKKEAKRLQALAKAATKQKKPTPVPNAAKKEKKEKEKAAAVEEAAEVWINPTKPGEKKGKYI
jgi:valyl-tRNA synthetase